VTVDLHVRESGAGIPLVLLHAFPLSSTMWLDVRNDLAGGARVITPDLRGFGGSGLGDDEPSLDHMADDVAALLDRFGLDRVVLGGLSMGGYVSMAFLRRHPARVAALVLADTKAGADPEPARANRERIAAALDAEGTARVLLDDVLPTLCGGTTVRARPLVIGRVRALVEATPPAAAAWAQRAMAARPDSIETLQATDVPALVLVGDEDSLVDEPTARELTDALPQGRLVTLPGSGHLSAVETPEPFAAAVSSFVSGLATGGPG
jgi:pimeloyl-ACP methyl ester carboxylesterase